MEKGLTVRVIKKSGLFVSIGLMFAASAFAQYWPKPATTPGVDVTCTGCLNLAAGKLTPGYPTTITRFTGRFLDSQATQDYQQSFRTARAFQIVPAPSRGRIYMIIGSAVFAYDMNTFFTRLGANETWDDGNSVPVSGVYASVKHPFPVDVFLRYDAFFYAENEPNGWIINNNDGQERLFGIDYDDQGYVYAAYTLYGWGIVKDDGTDTGQLMQSVSQYVGGTNDVYPRLITALKGSTGRYYAVISDQGTGIQVFDVTDRSAPQRFNPLIGKTAFNWARTPAGDRLGIATAQGKLQIYSTDGLVSGQGPLAEFNGVGGSVMKGVACDGTNFYTTSDTPNGLVISVFAPSGGTYTRVGDYPASNKVYGTSQHLSYGDGYLCWAGTNNGGANMRVFKLQNGVPTEIDFGNYFQHYYTIPQTAAYAKPAFSYFWDSNVIKKNNKVYLFVTAYSLGDVYELPSADSVTVNSQGVGGTANPKNTAGVVGPFPGDPNLFNATTGAPSPMNITWDFGDGTTAAGLTGTQVTHPYSGTLLGSSATRTLTVKATNANDSSITSSVPVTLQKPTVRFGVGNPAYLFLQPDASSPAPIVAGDTFFDASDGSIQSHYDTWAIDANVPINTIPPGAVPVGACGQHTLAFDAHFGPYDPASLRSTGIDLPIGIHSVTYTVRAFSPAITVTSTASSVTFTNATRISSDPAVLPAGTQLTYNWALLNGSGQPVATLAGPGPFTVSKTLFTGNNFKAHLVVTAPLAAGTSCPQTTADAFTPPLNGPDPGAIQGGCTGAQGGPPCSFTISSLSGADSDWTYAWSVNPTMGVTPLSSNTKTYAPNFATAGNYTVSVMVTNSIGSKSASTQTFSVPGATCPTMTTNSVFISHFGPTSGCRLPTDSCRIGESIAFQASTFGYDFTCSPHQFVWNFGDGSSSTVQYPTVTQNHSYSGSGTYTVTLTISNNAQSLALSPQTVVVTGTPPPPPPPPPPTPSGCPVMSAGNIFIHYQGTTTGCSENPSAPPCASGEPISLTVLGYNYDFNCANHQFSWSFGLSGQAVTHSFTSSAQVSVTINNGSQQYVATTNVTVGGSGPPPNPPPTGGCQPLVPGTSVFVSFLGPQSGCSPYNSNDCSTQELIPFEASAFSPYDFSCATHTFDWNWGDSSPHGSGQKANHQYTNAGTYGLKLTVTVNGANYVMNQTVHVAGSSGTTTPAAFDFVTTPIAGVPNGYTFKAFSPTGAALASTFNWNFGDNTPTVTGGAIQAKVYPDSQNYVVTLSAPGYQGISQHGVDDAQSRRRPSAHP